jgi:3-hydroxypropanoate dehydrogenase
MRKQLSAERTPMTTAPLTDTRLPTVDNEARRILFTEARTANTFASDAVSDEELHAIYELAKFGPTSANTNPMRILFVRRGEGRDRLLPLMSDGNRGKTASAPIVAVLAIDDDFHERIPELLPFKPELRDVFAANDAMRERTAQYNGALQAAYFIFAVRAVGLAAGPMAGFDSAGVDAEFFAGTSWRSQVVINIGHPGAGAWFDRLPRPSFADVVQFV